MDHAAALERDDLLDFLEHYDARGGTRNQAIQALRSFYGWAFEGELIQRNPARRLKTKRPKYGPAPYLTIEQLTRLILAAAWREPRRGWAIMLMYSTGIRLGSAAALMPEDVQDGRLRIRVAKNDRPYSVPLNRIGATAAAELRALAEKRAAQGGNSSLIGVGGGSLWYWINRAGKDAELDAHPHLLRHSFATRLAEKQVHPSTIQDLMNHADLSQLTRYVTIADPSKRAAVELLDEDFG